MYLLISKIPGFRFLLSAISTNPTSTIMLQIQCTCTLCALVEIYMIFSVTKLEVTLIPYPRHVKLRFSDIGITLNQFEEMTFQ